MFYNTNLPPHLRTLKDEIEGYARDYGLDFFETIFEVIDADDLNEIAAYGGFPTRYPHWSFGMQYEELSKGYDYGLSKIYEMVINNDPCYAYLMRCNHMVDQKLVMAHVYGHCDFFKNNAYFSHTNRKMMDEIANHAARIRDYAERFGEDEVESFMDRCMSLDDLIDIHSTAIKRRDDHSRYDFQEKEEEPEERRFKSKDYMDEYINPRKKRVDDDDGKPKKQAPLNFPDHPEKDILLFLIEHAPLKNWQRDMLSIVRDEAYYFMPQGQTKIINEGWASFWHSTIMTQKVLQPSEVIDYADHHSGTMAMSGGRLNPYKLGIELLRDVEMRWNTGKFGPEYDDCDDLDEKRKWDKQLGLGRQKIFEVRKVHNDITFIDTYLTPEFCARHKLFSFGYNDSAEQYLIESREFPKIKERLLFSLTNFGRPWIVVMNGNHRNRGELLLKHIHNGLDLKEDPAKDTLANIQYLWNRPVHIETVIEGKPALLSFDGTDHTTQLIGRPMLNEAATQKLSELPPGAAGETAIHLPGWGLYIDLEQNDTLGCRMRDLRLIRGLGESTLTADQVGAWATQVAEKATGLMEPLGVVEVDRARPEALLRSRKPVRKGPEAVRYYEVRLAGDGSCVLKRFEAYPAKNAREAIPFTLTHEGMAKFVDDVGSNLG